MPALCPPEELVVEFVRFSAGPYRLEGELAYPDALEPEGLVVLAGPHPLLGGHLGNNVVRALGDGLARRGAITLRFNYRGVGRSEGPPIDLAGRMAEFWLRSRIDDEDDYHQDVSGALDFLRSVPSGPSETSARVALVGYSFGCSLLSAVPIDAAAVLVLIAPTVGTHDLSGLEALPNPKLVIAPEADFAADAGLLRPWFDRLAGPKELVRPRLDGHFFRGHEEWLVETVGAFLGRQGR